MQTTENKTDIEKTTTNDTTKPIDPAVKIPKKRGRKPKYPPESRKFKVSHEPISITFD